MKWSFSAATTFVICPRRWFYANVCANARAKDRIRKQAYHLKQLQTLSAWRGSLVDTVINVAIVPKLNNSTIPSEGNVLNYASSLATKQLEFGKARRHKEPEVTKKGTGTSFCAFYDLEYNNGIDEKELSQAKDEAMTALKNILSSSLLCRLAESTSYLIAQRPLQFDFAGVSMRCTPDMIAFFEDAPPLIVDWKVHSFAYADYRLQLALYALALSRVSPHKDFPSFNASPEQMELIEYQLLKDNQRRYTLTEEDIIDLEDYIYDSIRKIQHIIADIPAKELQAGQFHTARSSKACMRCLYKKICWANEPAIPKQLEVFA